MRTCIHGADLFLLCPDCEKTRQAVHGDQRVEAPVPTAEVRKFTGITRHNLDPERVLDGARNAKLDSVTVIGYDSNGEFYFASTEAGGPSVLWDLQKAIHKLMEIGE